MTTGSFSFHCRLIYYGQFRLCDKWRYNGGYSALTLSGCRDSDSQFLWKKKGDGLGLYSFVSQLYAVKQFRKHVNIISTFRGHRHNFRSSISSWLLWFLCKIILHLRIYFLTPLCTHTPPSTIYNFSPPLRTSKKCIIIDSPTSTYSGWYVVHYWLQDERFFRLVQLFLKGQHLAFSILVTAQLKHPCKKGMEAVRRLECLKFTASENATTWDLCKWQSPLYL